MSSASLSFLLHHSNHSPGKPECAKPRVRAEPGEPQALISDFLQAFPLPHGLLTANDNGVGVMDNAVTNRVCQDRIGELLSPARNVKLGTQDALVKENAAAPQSQKVYNAKYENLTKRYETASAELDRLRGLRAKREQQDKAMASFIRSLRKQPEVMNTWNDTIWTVMVEKAIVHRDSSITFKFYNGAEIHVGNEKVCW